MNPTLKLRLAAFTACALMACSEKPAEDAHGHAAGSEHDEADHEAKVTIDAKTAQEIGLRTARAGAGTVRDEHEVQGLLTTVEGRHARVRARFPGPVQSVRVSVGDRPRGPGARRRREQRQPRALHDHRADCRHAS